MLNYLFSSFSQIFSNRDKDEVLKDARLYSILYAVVGFIGLIINCVAVSTYNNALQWIIEILYCIVHVIQYIIEAAMYVHVHVPYFLLLVTDILQNILYKYALIYYYYYYYYYYY